MNDRTKLSAYLMLKILILATFFVIGVIILGEMGTASDLDEYGTSRFNTLCVALPMILFWSLVFQASVMVLSDRMKTIRARMNGSEPEPFDSDIAPYIVIAGLGMLMAYAYSGWVDPYMLGRDREDVLAVSMVPIIAEIALMYMVIGIRRYKKATKTAEACP